MTSRIAILIGCACAAGCAGPGSYVDGNPRGGDFPVVWIRVGNASDIDFDRINVHFPNQVEDYGSLPAGEVSEYREIDGAYRYAYSVAHAGDRRFVLQPIDFVGESPLRAGRYTYRFSVDLLDEPTSAQEAKLHGFMDVRLKTDSIGN